MLKNDIIVKREEQIIIKCINILLICKKMSKSLICVICNRDKIVDLSHKEKLMKELVHDLFG